MNFLVGLRRGNRRRNGMEELKRTCMRCGAGIPLLVNSCPKCGAVQVDEHKKCRKARDRRISRAITVGLWMLPLLLVLLRGCLRENRRQRTRDSINKILTKGDSNDNNRGRREGAESRQTLVIRCNGI